LKWKLVPVEREKGKPEVSCDDTLGLAEITGETSGFPSMAEDYCGT